MVFSVFLRGFKCWLLALSLMLVGLGQAQAGQPAESLAWKTAVAITATLIYATNPVGADRMTVEGGGGEDVGVLRIGAQWDWNDDLLELWGYSLSTYWQFDYSKWQSTKDSSQRGANNTLGLSPVFRFTRKTGSVRPYLDTSVGVYLFSSTQVNGSNFGDAFQFSDMLGLGLLVGKRQQWGLGYKFQHYSNGSTALPNNGINFHFLTVSYEY